ncbi:hypothetical protein NP233_g8779 [Leucocoprinus birnbaumii]|uniref:Uncharacterized protein n=1 Tax=Leucocoprinus birnbaumii TaxID=56174 RepID=A0AAD5VLP6_9AGAR|nr:hypothetical protein NP233_g8779 [Leucocoprinus birnbaumii]
MELSAFLVLGGLQKLAQNSTTAPTWRGLFGQHTSTALLEEGAFKNTPEMSATPNGRMIFSFTKHPKLRILSPKRTPFIPPQHALCDSARIPIMSGTPELVSAHSDPQATADLPLTHTRHIGDKSCIYPLKCFGGCEPGSSGLVQRSFSFFTREPHQFRACIGGMAGTGSTRLSVPGCTTEQKAIDAKNTTAEESCDFLWVFYDTYHMYHTRVGLAYHSHLVHPKTPGLSQGSHKR